MLFEELEAADSLRLLPLAAGEAVRDEGAEGEWEKAADDGREEAGDTGAARMERRWGSVWGDSGVSNLASEREIEDSASSEEQGISTAVWYHQLFLQTKDANATYQVEVPCLCHWTKYENPTLRICEWLPVEQGQVCRLTGQLRCGCYVSPV